MTLTSLSLYAGILRHFRNWRELISAVRIGNTCERGLLWNGLKFSHPHGQDGLADVLIETWVEEVYTNAGFYSPRDGDVVLDVGANVGVFSVYIAHQNPKCRVLALEPFPDNFTYLELNIAQNRIENVQPHRIALHGRVLVAYMKRGGERSLDHVLCDGAGDGTAVEVPTCTLGELLDMAQADRVALLKIDIEGTEKPVFEQATSDILRRFDRIAVEYHDNLRPGALQAIRTALNDTHRIELKPSTVEGCGVLRAVLQI